MNVIDPAVLIDCIKRAPECAELLRGVSDAQNGKSNGVDIGGETYRVHKLPCKPRKTLAAELVDYMPPESPELE